MGSRTAMEGKRMIAFKAACPSFRLMTQIPVSARHDQVMLTLKGHDDSLGVKRKMKAADMQLAMAL